MATGTQWSARHRNTQRAFLIPLVATAVCALLPASLPSGAAWAVQNELPGSQLPTTPPVFGAYRCKDGQGRSKVTPRELLESCLRLRPDRILLGAEVLRSEEAFYYLGNVASAHRGSITSIHAGRCGRAL